MKGAATFSGRYARRDWIIAIVLIGIVFLLGLGQMTRGVPYWGDDSAAYLSEGIAIANGELADQAARNPMLHPSSLPKEAQSSDLVYVWGYPLFLSLVYKLVGFDTQSFTSIIYYKIPSLVCLSLLAGVLYLFFLRRFSRRISAPLALIFCLTGNFIYTINTLYSDVCFLFFSTLALLLIELFLESETASARGPSLPLGAVLGAVLWYTYETRLNGIAICLTVLIAQLIYLLPRRASLRAPGRLLRHLLPYLLFIALRIVSERLLLPPTPNMSDVGTTDLHKVIYYALYYGYFTLDYLNSLTGFPVYIGILFCIPIFVGFFRDGFRRENLHLTLLFVGTYVINLTLPYGQRLRYLYSILPVMMLYLVFGAQRILNWLAPRFRIQNRRSLGHRLAALLLIVVLASAAAADIRNLSAGGRPSENDMYASDSVEMYRYIQENTAVDALIACVKPRAVYLNTGRMGYHAGYNGYKLLDADYYLYIESDDFAEGNLITEKIRDRFQVEYATEHLTLYRITESAS